MILYKHYDLLFLGAIAFPWFLDSFISQPQRKRIITFSLAIFLSIYFSLSLFSIFPASISGFVRDRIKIDAVADNDVAILAQKFQRLSPEDALVLVPPLDEQFRFYSRRAVVFTFKSFPFTDEGIKVWRDRLETIAGTQDFSKYTLNEFYDNHSNSEIIAIAKQFNADYILTRLDWHQDLDGLIIAQQGDWIIYQLKN